MGLRSISIMAALGLVSTVNAQTSSLAFTAPAALLDNGQPHVVVEHMPSLFGGSECSRESSLALRVQVVQGTSNDDLCLPASPKAGDLSLILLDGYINCRFQESAKNAQARGAKALLIMENKCIAANKDRNALKNPKWAAHCDQVGYIDKLNYMDGSDNSIVIPSMLVSRWEGMRLLECQRQASGEPIANQVTDANCKAGEFPIVQLRWNIPQSDKVGLELWSSSLLNADLFVKESWAKEVMPKLVEVTDFTPAFFVYDGEKLGCTTDVGGAHCKDACHNKNKYCHYDSDGFDSNQITGRRISQENLRQYCAYQAVKDSSAGKLKWWNYVSQVAKFCTGLNASIAFDKDLYYTEACSQHYHEQVGLDFSKTMKCIKDAGNYGPDDEDNQIWKKMLTQRVTEKKIDHLPTLIVNGKVVDFGNTLQNIVSSVCCAFKIQSRPSFCDCVDQHLYATERKMVDVCFLGIDNDTVPVGPSSGGVGTGTVFVIVLFVSGALTAGFFVYTKYDRRRMRSALHEDVRNIMGEYMRMDQEDEEHGSDRGGFSRGRVGQQQHSVVELG